MPMIEFEFEGNLVNQPVPDGRYDLRIDAFDLAPTKRGDREMWTARLRIEHPDYPDAAAVFHRFLKPHPDDQGTARDLRVRDLLSFCQVFGIEHEFEAATKRFRFDPDSVVGQSGECDLRQREYEGRVSNELRLPDPKV